MNTLSFHAMGSRILIAMDTEIGTLNQAVVEATQWFEEWEQIFSRFRSTSELSELNQHSGQNWVVSPDFFQVLKLAVAVEKKTDGLVTPKILNALEQAGYTTSFEDMAENMGRYLDQSFAAVDAFQAIEFDEVNRSVRIPRGVRLDLGGIVKGWAAQQTMLRLREIAPVLVDAGGDIAISGSLMNGDAWAVGVSDPIHANQSLDLVMLNECGIATSGRDYRRWKVANQWQHHIIDPRTDHPAETDILSVTVIASDIMKAEAWAKAALILGSQAATQKLENDLQLASLIVLEDGSTIESPRFTQYRWNEKWQIRQNSLSI
ncbi:MAG: FAD:protein FMN transferase [Anaerolineaceae bacterium]